MTDTWFLPEPGTILLISGINVIAFCQKKMDIVNEKEMSPE